MAQHISPYHAPDFFTDALAKGRHRDIVGGRAGSYETVLRDARQQALSELAEEARKMGSNAVVGIDLDYEVLGQGGSMLMVSASGTAVTVS